jgi:hypothetical protein
MDDMRGPKVNLTSLIIRFLLVAKTALPWRSDSQPDPVQECVLIRVMETAHDDAGVGVSLAPAKAGEAMWRGMPAEGRAAHSKGCED